MCQEKAYGRQCDECQPGYFNFPTCEPCQCNGHASTCHQVTGICIDCRSNTAGDHCEQCLTGWYGAPTLEDNIPCKECPCPDTKASGHSFADTCSLDPEDPTQRPICDCQEEYVGRSCDKCRDNYFGDPEIPGGSCVRCNCSDNWKEDEVGNCDSATGVCLKCIFNTEGDHCEYCESGYFGDAVEGTCEACQCDQLGTDPENFACDRFTGECTCLPHVVGNNCDTCEVDHWKIASGVGCEYCDCDMVGSTSTTCNLYTGQCECKKGVVTNASFFHMFILSI